MFLEPLSQPIEATDAHGTQRATWRAWFPQVNMGSPLDYRVHSICWLGNLADANDMLSFERHPSPAIQAKELPSVFIPADTARELLAARDGKSAGEIRGAELAKAHFDILAKAAAAAAAEASPAGPA